MVMLMRIEYNKNSVEGKIDNFVLSEWAFYWYSTHTNSIELCEWALERPLHLDFTTKLLLLLLFFFYILSFPFLYPQPNGTIFH